ncbi:MAG: hypothetical protein FJ318_04260 [SAR202 cluster bacterium]|nr:hypothetical protein [SAR202 cluster bacterium]
MVKALVLDANILVRAVLGRRVLAILETHANRVHFLAPEIAFTDARLHLPDILVGRGLPRETVAPLIEDVLERLPELVTPVPHEVYADGEAEARRAWLQTTRQGPRCLVEGGPSS